MNRVAGTPETRADDLDALLGAFFQAEMPKPWPAFRAPTRRRSVLPLANWSSRLALVAAVVLLLLAAWLVPGPSGASRGDRPGALPTIGEPTATGKHGLEQGGAPVKARPRAAKKGASQDSQR